MNSNQALYKLPTDIRNYYIEQSLNISMTAPYNINNKPPRKPMRHLAKAYSN